MSKDKSTKVHLTEIEVITGEEGERNVLQVSLLSMNKTFLYNKIDIATYVNNMLVLQNFTIARKSGNILLVCEKNVSAFSCNSEIATYVILLPSNVA